MPARQAGYLHHIASPTTQLPNPALIAWELYSHAVSRLRPRLRRARFAVACGVLAAIVAQLVYHGGPPGVDLPSHLFQTWLYAHAGFNLWNNYWYAGRYEFVTYSVLYYPLASVVGQQSAATASAAVLAGAFAGVSRREWGGAATGPSLAFAATAPFILMVGGLFPFLAGSAAGGAALMCLQRRWRTGFGISLLATLGFSPLAFALLMAVLAAALLGQPRPGAALRRNRAAFAAVVAVFVIAVVVERAFPSGAWYPYDLTDAAIVFGFSLTGLYITGSSPRARSLRMLFACYLALNLVAFLLKGPIGSNSSRLFVIAGAPLLWLAANVSRERSRLIVLPVLAAALALQVGPFVRDAYSSWGDPASDPAYWRPAARFLAAHNGAEHRVEVVATWGHWEAYYLAKRGIPLARGWFRQDDFPQNTVLYSDHLTGPAYRHWLRSLGVRYVLLSDAKLDYSAVREAALLRSGTSGLRVVDHDGHWTIYELPHPTPIVSPPPGDRGLIVHLGPGRVVLWTSAPGRYLVRIRSSPYWSASPSTTCVGSSPRGMTTVTTSTGGYVKLTLDPGLAEVAETVGGAASSC